MPRNVRNFWIELDVDGRSSKIETGPRSSTGCVSIKIKVRENGMVSDKEVWIGCTVDSEGRLEVRARRSDTGMSKVLLRTIR